MTIMSMTAVHPHPGASWEEIQKNVKAGNDLTRKLGGENVTAMVTMIAGEATGTVTTIWTAPDWVKFGQVQEAMMTDPELLGLMATGGLTATWSTYVSMTIPDM
jgi:hypothetical protein